jgi:hypothetical protein
VNIYLHEIKVNIYFPFRKHLPVGRMFCGIFWVADEEHQDTGDGNESGAYVIARFARAQRRLIEKSC